MKIPGPVLAKARGHLLRALASDRREDKSVRFAQAAAYLSFADGFLETLPPTPRGKAGAGLPRSTIAYYRTQYLREWPRLQALPPAPAAPPETETWIHSVIHALANSPGPRTLAEMRRHLKGLRAKQPYAFGEGLLKAWAEPRIGQVVDILYRVNVLTTPGPETNLLCDAGRSSPKAVQPRAVALFFPGLNLGRPPKLLRGPRPEGTDLRPFRMSTFLKEVHRADPQARQNAWLSLARHNLTAAKGVVASALMSLRPASDLSSDPYFRVLSDDGRLNQPHPMIKHVVQDPHLPTARVAFAALGSLEKSPFLPHILRILEGPGEGDREAALAALLLYAKKNPSSRRLLSRYPVSSGVRRFVARHALPGLDDL